MPALSERRSPHRTGFLGWLWYELAPRDGRWWSVARITTGCTITVAIAMLFQIPEPAYMAYIVFLISKDEKASTFVAGAGGLIAVTLAVVTTLGLSIIDLSEPALRLPAMAAMTFIAMYSIRVFALGPITFLAGFVIVLLQSMVDQIPSPEALTRITLWIWVVLFVPIVITVVLNILFAPSVAALRNREFKRIVGDLALSLRECRDDIPLERYRERVIELLDKKSPEESAPAKFADANAAVLRQLLNLLVLLETVDADLVLLHGAAWADSLEAIRTRIGQPLSASEPSPEAPVAIERHTSVIAIDANLKSLDGAFNEAAARTQMGSAERSLLAKDALSNPAHWQFAFKTTLAVMIVYALYMLMDWPGMRTSIVTCFFVALGSLGETVHKLTLRLSGAVIGGLLAALSIVFVLPHCTDIGQLCLLIALVSAGAAWVATSSEQLAYAGMQTAFAFFLGVLQSYAPATDLAVMRDRVAGILLGNVVMTIVFSTLWSQSAASRVRRAFRDVLRALATLLKSPAQADMHAEQAVRGLVVAEHFRTLRGFELQLVSGQPTVERIVGSLRALVMLESSIFISMSPAVASHYRDEDRRALSHWASESAAAAEAGVSWPSPPTLTPGHSAVLYEVLDAARQAADSSSPQVRL